MSEPIYPVNVDAQAEIAAAQARAGQSGQRVAVVFGADWCPDCVALERFLEHRLVVPIVDPGFQVVKVNVGDRDTNLDLMAQYGMKVVSGIPAVAVLEADGTLVEAQVAGEFRSARSLAVNDVVEFFHRLRPVVSE